MFAGRSGITKGERLGCSFVMLAAPMMRGISLYSPDRAVSILCFNATVSHFLKTSFVGRLVFHGFSTAGVCGHCRMRASPDCGS